jgi:TolA-binding protein
MRGRPLHVILLCLALGSSGCLMMKKDGDALAEANQKNEQRVAQLEAEVRAKDLAMQAKLAELQQGLERTRALLTRDSADVGAQVQSQEQRMAEIEGKLAELQHGLSDAIQQNAKAKVEFDDKLTKLATTKPTVGTEPAAVDPSLVPEDKTAHFAAAYEAYKAGDHEKARALFKEFLTRYAADDKAGEAQYWIGASFLVQNKPATALGEYRKVIATYPKSAAVDTALYGMADAFYRLHACTDAKGAIDALLKRKPSKGLTDRANELLRAVTAAPKDYCTS